MMTGTKRYSASCLSSLTNVRPSMRGMCTSQIMRSTLLPSSIPSASLPSAAPITSYPASTSASTTLRRRAAESSMTMILFATSRLLLQHFLDDVEQHGRIERLHQPAGHARLLARRLQFVSVLGGEHENGREAEVRHCPQGLDEFQAVFPGHVQVGDHEVELGFRSTSQSLVHPDASATVWPASVSVKLTTCRMVAASSTARMLAIKIPF